MITNARKALPYRSTIFATITTALKTTYIVYLKYIFLCRAKTGPRQTDREQRRLAEKGNPKYIFTIPIAILPQPSFCDEITVTKPLVRGQLTWLGQKRQNEVNFTLYFIETTVAPIFFKRVSGLAEKISYDNQSVNIFKH